MKAFSRAALAYFLLDQISKWLVVRQMGLAQVGEIDVWPPWVNFRMAWNRGINFGLFSGDSDTTRWILIALALVITVWVSSWVWRGQLGRAGCISAGILVGGALGNVVDRLVYGAVADFLNVTCCGIENPFAFNFADIGVFIGAFGMILFSGEPKTGNKTP